MSETVLHPSRRDALRTIRGHNGPKSRWVWRSEWAPNAPTTLHYREGESTHREAAQTDPVATITPDPLADGQRYGERTGWTVHLHHPKFPHQFYIDVHAVDDLSQRLSWHQVCKIVKSLVSR